MVTHFQLAQSTKYKMLSCFLRSIFCCATRCARSCGYKPVIKTVHSSKLPWFWIGARTDRRSETVTDIVNRCVKYGHVDIQFLEDVTGIKNATWSYIDAETLEEKIFPSEGFLIEQ